MDFICEHHEAEKCLFSSNAVQNQDKLEGAG
jgi:hypothetical protein